MALEGSKFAAPVTPYHQVESEMTWLTECIAWRNENPFGNFSEAGPTPALLGMGAFSEFATKHNLSIEERLVIALCLASQFDAGILHALNLEANKASLVLYAPTGNLIPTIGTALYLIGGAIPSERLKYRYLFQAEHLFYKKSVLDLGEVPRNVPEFTATIALSPQYSDLFVHGTYRRPRFSHEFPAHLLETLMTWDDLVLNPGTRNRLEELKNWFSLSEALANDPRMGRHFKQGYRCLFSGPSGTGKSLAATLLGQHIDRDVYRVDLSAVISKYIGETSKNLNALFDTAEDKDWILFFDEGDALFGKRVDTAAADNKNATFANQDVAFLLQRIEAFRGIVIVATNFRKNMDDAFSRRFNQVINFDIPNLENAVRFWREHLPKAVEFPAELDLELLVKRQQLSCAGIINVLQRVTLLTLAKSNKVIARTDLDFCIQDEAAK